MIAFAGHIPCLYLRGQDHSLCNGLCRYIGDQGPQQQKRSKDSRRMYQSAIHASAASLRDTLLARHVREELRDQPVGRRPLLPHYKVARVGDLVVGVCSGYV